MASVGAKAPTGPRKARPDDKLRAVSTGSFAETSGQFGRLTARVGERKRVEERAAFDLEPPIARHQSLPKRFGGHGASPLCPLYACLNSAAWSFTKSRMFIGASPVSLHMVSVMRS